MSDGELVGGKRVTSAGLLTEDDSLLLRECTRVWKGFKVLLTCFAYAKAVKRSQSSQTQWQAAMKGNSGRYQDDGTRESGMGGEST